MVIGNERIRRPGGVVDGVAGRQRDAADTVAAIVADSG
jgi:hypothetical protein